MKVTATTELAKEEPDFPCKELDHYEAGILTKVPAGWGPKIGDPVMRVGQGQGWVVLFPKSKGWENSAFALEDLRCRRLRPGEKLTIVVEG